MVVESPLQHHFIQTCLIHNALEKQTKHCDKNAKKKTQKTMIPEMKTKLV